MSAPRIDAVDAELAALREATGRLAVTLMALDSDPTRSTLDRARGRTATRWLQPSADLAAAWALYPHLSATVDAVTELRGTERKPGRDTAATVDTALRGPVDLAAAGVDAVARARLAELTGGSAPHPAGLAAAVTDLLAGLPDVYAEVRTAQAALLPRAEASVRALDELRTAVDGVAGTAAGRAVIDRVDALTDTLAADPLGLTVADFDAADEAIALAHAEATSAEALRDHLNERLAAGRALLAALPGLIAEARTARELTATKIADLDPAGTDPTDADLRALAGELAALDALAAADRWRVLAARRPAWSAKLHALTTRATTARDRHRGLLAHRDELRGRLEAYQAKARARGLAEDPELSRLADDARDTLYTAPCDLAAADRLVAAYQDAMRSRLNRQGPR